jgi:hypothetical protein
MSTHESKTDFFEVGDKTSLICADPNTGESVRIALRELGYKYHTAETGETAIERIRYTQYDCIVIQEDFSGTSLRSNPVLNYLSPLPMSQRRSSFTCVIGPSFKTLDAMQAFQQSVHLVIGPGDLPNLTAILRKGLTEFESLYRVYRETVAAQGKK